MSCLVASMDAANYWMSAYFSSPPRTNWWHPMVLSQGIGIGTSFQEARGEVGKIVEYWEKGGANPPDSWRAGWGVPPAHLFHYLHRRDEIVAAQKFPLADFKASDYGE